MAKIKIQLDGRFIRNDEYSFESISVSKTIEAQKDITQDITFYKGAYQQIKEALIDPRFGYVESLPIRIFDTCCNKDGVLIFDGRIEGKSLEFCQDDCYVRTTATSQSPLLDCLKGQILSQGLDDISHFNLIGIEDRSDFQKVVTSILSVVSTILSLLATAILLPILSFLTVVELFIQLIDVLLDRLRSVPLLSGIIPDIIKRDDRNILPDLGNFEDLVRGLNKQISRLDAVSYYPAPFIRTMLQNACDQCGARLGNDYEFVSSIFTDSNSEYYNTAWFRPDGKGLESPKRTGLSDNNKPLTTAESLLDDLRGVFNARWWVDGGTLRFEPKSFTRGAVDYSDKKACFGFIEEDLPARAEILYQRDPIDLAGNVKLSEFNYLIEFASDGTAQRGKKDYQLSFSVPNISDVEASGASSNSKGVKTDANGVNFPKLVIFENASRLSDQKPLTGEVLWRNFFDATENPNTNGFKPRRFDINTVYECGQEIPLAGAFIQLSSGNGVVDAVDIDYSSREITLTGRA